MLLRVQAYRDSSRPVTGHTYNDFLYVCDDGPAMGRYHPGTHNEPTVCSECQAKNAPRDTVEFDETCWRCDSQLVTALCEGDVVEVDIVDVGRNGNAVGKTDEGLVVFCDQPADGQLTATVEITEIEPSHGKATLLD